MNHDGFFETSVENNDNPEMMALRDSSNTFSNRTLYHGVLFLIGPPATSSNPNIITKAYGRMGFGKAGYFFPKNFSANIHFYKTIAHEVGHGIFNLKHPFRDTGYLDDYYNDGVDRSCYPSPEGSLEECSNFKDSDNLMDYYMEGILLRAYQWDLIKEVSIEDL